MQPMHADAAQDSAQAPHEDASQDQGGGMSEQLVALDKQLYQVVSLISKAQVPDEVKQPFQAALEAYRAGLSALTGAAGGGNAQGAVSPEQGASGGAVPMSHGRP